MPEESSAFLTRPTLEVGLIGFSRQQAASVARALESTGSGGVRWSVGPLERADAWWVHGSRAQLLDDGSLRVAAGDAGGRSVRLSLEDVDRPLAFCEPIACPELDPALSVRIESDVDVLQSLQDIEARWLRGTVARLWLAEQLVSCEGRLENRVYHLVLHGELLAVVDRKGDVGIAQGVSLARLQAAAWVGRPSSAAFIPPAFDRTSLSVLAWTYALRSRGQHLPERYRTQRMVLRRPPKVPRRLLRDEHLRVMSQLARGPSTFTALQERLQIEADALAAILGALYLTGSITVSAHRTRLGTPTARPEQADVASGSSAWTLSGSSRLPVAGSSLRPPDATVPVLLHA